MACSRTTHPTLSSLSIFFPFFNDAGTVLPAIAQAYQIGQRITSNLEVIAVHGGPSRDDTWLRIQHARKKYPNLMTINKQTNTEGYAVIKHGLRAATQDWVFYTDGDLQYNLWQLVDLVRRQNSTLADVINGWKINRQDHFWRQFTGEAYRAWAKLYFRLPITDLDCDFRLIRRSYLEKISLESKDSSILTEMILNLQQAGANFAEVPVKHFARTYGQSNYDLWQLTTEKILGDSRLSLAHFSRKIGL